MITVNEQRIVFYDGMTVADALKAAGELTDAWVLVVLDGKVIPRNKLDIVFVAEGTHIKLLPVLTGG
ncbi:MAG: hypothetical protein K0R80_1931 [Clostridia bacterium]|jgi:thiamine biosynthesis protein ThiS|nr:hypothetical protein [Clostridia bacterium]